MPVIGFVAHAKYTDPPQTSTNPSASPCSSPTRRCAIGREAVRGIRRSVLRSSAWFNTLDPAVTSAIPSSAFTSPI